MTKEKPQLPPSCIYLNDIPQYLKSFQYDITYDGLFYYRRLGILPEPERLPKSKFKYYDESLILETMFLVEFMRATFRLSTEKIGEVLKKIGLEFAKHAVYVYFKFVSRFLQKEAEKRDRSPVSSFEGIRRLGRMLGMSLWHCAYKVEKIEKLSALEFERVLIKAFEQETYDISSLVGKGLSHDAFYQKVGQLMGDKITEAIKKSQEGAEGQQKLDK